jgi:hypothetical protein
MLHQNSTLELSITWNKVALLIIYQEVTVQAWLDITPKEEPQGLWHMLDVGGFCPEAEVEAEVKKGR